jgi:hypothetical protein
MGKEKDSAQKTIETIRRKARRKHSAENKICIVMEGLKGEDTIAELWRKNYRYGQTTHQMAAWAITLTCAAPRPAHGSARSIPTTCGGGAQSSLLLALKAPAIPIGHLVA